MATNAEQFKQHFKENIGAYRSAMSNGIITEEDIKAAGNAGGNYSYADQDAALQRINDAFGNFAKQHPDEERLNKFVSGIPQIQKFEPKAEDWQKYNNEQMGRLAESMKFNWRNKEDRSQMMKQLMNEQILKDKKKIYQDYKKDNPVAAFINENILAPNVSNRMSKGEDITNTDVALDAANVGTMLIPGAGVGGTAARKAAAIGADVAAQAAIQAGSDINQGRELGWHNIYMPVAGAAAGTMPEMLPRMAKGIVDVVAPGLGRMGKKIGDKAEDFIINVFGDKVGAAKQTLRSEAEAAGKSKTYAKNMSEKNKTAARTAGEMPTPNAADKQFAKDKAYFAEHPDVWEDVVNGKASYHGKQMTGVEADKFLADPNFSTAIKAAKKAESKAAKYGKEAAKGVSQTGARDFFIAKENESRHKEAKPKIEQVFASPELADWVRLKKRGYNPAIPSQFREYEEQLNAMIHDPNRNLR